MRVIKKIKLVHPVFVYVFSLQIVSIKYLNKRINKSIR